METDERGEHIGIQNLLSRMRLLYAEEASWEFTNGEDGGAVILLVLPRESEREE